jgi:hypothetical protein
MDHGALPFDDQLRVPRLRVQHLLVGLGLAGVLLATEFAISAMEMHVLRNSPTAKSLNVAAILSALIPWWTRLLQAFTIVGFAAALVGTAVLLRAKFRRISDRLQPGHWLVLSLAIGGALVAIARPFELLDLALFYSYRKWPDKVLVAVTLINIISVGGIRGVAAARLRDGWKWRALLALCATNALQSLILFATKCYPSSQVQPWMPVLAWLLPCWWVFLLLTTAAVVVMDRPRWSARDWAHWLGVSLWMLHAAAMLLLLLGAPWILGISRPAAKRDMSAEAGTDALRLKGTVHQRLGWKAEDFFTDAGVISLCKAIEAKDLAAINRLVKSGVNVRGQKGGAKGDILL